MKKIMNNLRAGLVALVIVAFAGMSVQAQQVWEKTVTVNPKPQVSMAAQTVCQGDSVRVDFIGTEPFKLTYTIAGGSFSPGTLPEQFGAGGYKLVANGTDANGTPKYYAKIKAGEAGTFTFNLTKIESTATSCANTDVQSVQIVVNAAPEATIDDTPASMCMGQSRTITFSKGTAEYKLYFRDSHYAPTGTSLTSTSSALTIAADRPGTYTYTFDSIVDKNGTGCRSLADFKITSDNTWTVTVHALPTAEITETTICQNTNATLTFTGKSPFTLTGTPAGTWTYASGATTGIPTPYTGTWGTATQLSSPNPTDDMSYPVAVLAGSAGTFNFSGTLTDANGCSATVSDAVTVNAEPTIDIATPVCQNTNNNITLTGKAPWNVTWTSSPSVGVASPLTISGSPYQIMSGSAGTFTFTVAVGGLVDDNKCANTTVITKDVVVNPEPAIKLEYEELCQNANNNILVLAGTSTPSVNMNVAWTVSPTIGITSPMNLTASSTSIVSGQPGSFNFTVAAGGLTDNNTGCKNINALTQNVVVNPLPTVDFTPTTICAGDAITLNFTGKASVTKFTLDYKVEDVTLSTGRIAPETIGLPASDFNSLTTGTTDADGTTHYTATLNPGKPGDFKFYLKSVSDGTCTNNNPSPLW